MVDIKDDSVLISNGFAELMPYPTFSDGSYGKSVGVPSNP
jgi:hypothetical protein